MRWPNSALDSLAILSDWTEGNYQMNYKDSYHKCFEDEFLQFLKNMMNSILLEEKM